jgi:hypothetical protein
VVVDPGLGRGLRKLPSLYVNDVQLYADRDVDGVVGALERAVDAFVHSAERATYMLTACEIGGRRGLYGADFFNRTRARLELQRLGMRFSHDPFVVLRDDGSFESEDFPPFDPSFLLLAPSGAGESASTRPSAAALVHQFAYYRIADLGIEELHRLPAALARMDIVGAPSADAVVRAVTV